MERWSVFFVLLVAWAAEIVLAGYAEDVSHEEGDSNACSSYTNLTEADRLETFPVGKKSECDDAITGHHEWFRFVDDAGTRMPESCVSHGYCGADSPGWLVGKHPTKSGNSPARRRICFNEKGNCRAFCVEARVKLCGELDTGYYVYKLRSIPRPRNGQCSRRYCGTKTVSPCESYQELREANRNEAFRSRRKRSDSNLAPNTWYRFAGDAGTVMPTSCVPEGHCGTDAPGWLWLDKLPGPNRVVERARVCYHAEGECCKCKNEVAVKNCDGFYVYKFSPPPPCSGKKLRYCAADRLENPCESSKVFMEADRLESFKRHTKKNDANIKVNTWYQFSGNAGYKMPETCVDSKRCGTHAPGWLQGTHPQRKGQMVIRKICYHHESLCCAFGNDVAVINCGTYYAYKLTPPPKSKVNMRYCGVQRIGKTEECTKYSTLFESTRAASFNGKNVKACDKNIHKRAKWYRFDGLAGSRMATAPVPQGNCGTRSPGWMVGRLPSVEQRIVERQVCFREKKDRCKWSKTILVRNCGEFFVYHLPGSPQCSRYCGAEAPVSKWNEPIGCYRDKGKARALPVLYYNHRKPTLNDKKPTLNWVEYPTISQGIIHECAVGARDHGFPCFGVQFWGECWGAADGCETYYKHGWSSECEHGLGKHWTNHVYRAKCGSPHGCCDDHRTPKTNGKGSGCPEFHRAMDLALLVDSSDSMDPENFDLIRKRFLRSLMGLFTIHKDVTRVAIMQYSDHTEWLLELTSVLGQSWTEITKIARNMKRIHGRIGRTNTAAALEEAYKMFNESGRPDYHKRILLLTNDLSAPTPRLRDAVSNLKGLDLMRVVVMGVFVDAQSDTALLELIASSPQDLFVDPVFEDMMADVRPVAERLRPK